ncbi:hypothetical protein XENOCAPTIV_024579 [Xenoophorus captivus]|uniref:Uncharacterized protein n=1 Tax=Xenoophorus captivus TaxID=1517983 RepID=A0ABV0QJZ2_9TELE
MPPVLPVPESNRCNLLSPHQEELKEAGQSALQCLSVLPMWLFPSPGSVPVNLPDQVLETLKILLIRLQLAAPGFTILGPASSKSCPPSNKPHLHWHHLNDAERFRLLLCRGHDTYF